MRACIAVLRGDLWLDRALFQSSLLIGNLLSYLVLPNSSSITSMLPVPVCVLAWLTSVTEHEAEKFYRILFYAAVAGLGFFLLLRPAPKRAQPDVRALTWRVVWRCVSCRAGAQLAAEGREPEVCATASLVVCIVTFTQHI